MGKRKANVSALGHRTFSANWVKGHGDWGQGQHYLLRKEEAFILRAICALSSFLLSVDHLTRMLLSSMRVKAHP